MDTLRGKRLVIFGCGYVGAAVARAARAAGARVTALTRNEAKAIVLREEGIDTVVAELAGDAWHARIAGAPDFLLNCVSSGGAGLEGYRRSYVDGMASIVRWAETRGRAGTAVYTSSTSVYPQGHGETVTEESSHAGISERGAILLEAERLLRGSAACERWFILRLAGIYGPTRTSLVAQVRTGAVSGLAQHRLNLAHRDDIAAAILACFTAPARIGSGVFNVADDAPARKCDVAAWLAERLGVPPPAFTGEPIGGRRAVTPDRVIANARIKAVLGWRPRFPDFRAGYENVLSD